jgi:DNA-binding winged helix-turn-helix (wHTH) protein/Tol biopolymer transport system component
MLPTAVENVRPRPSSVGFGPFTFDRANGLLRHGTRELPLPPRALGVLDLLVSRAGEIVPKQEIIDSVWKEAFVTDTSLAEAISVLRQALGDDHQTPSYVQTVHRRGYRFVAPVTLLTPARAVNEVAPPPSPDSGRVSPSIGGHLVPWGIAVMCAILAAIALWQYTHLAPSIPPVVRMRIEPASGTSFDRRAPALALSPEGTVLAWAACHPACQLYVRGIDELDAHAMPGTDDASAPFFSPDGRSIGFFAGGKLKKVALAGGLPVSLTDASEPFGAVWMPDGHIIFAASARGGLLRVNDRGGDAGQLTLPSPDAGEVRHAWPARAADGRGVVFTIATSPLAGAPGRIAVLPSPHRAAWQTLVDGADTAAAVLEYLVFSRDSEIHAVALDRTRLSVIGTEQAVAAGIARRQFAIAQSGAMAYAAAGEPDAGAIDWAAAPSRSPFAAKLGVLQSPVLSPDGSRVAGTIGEDVWVGDLARIATTRLTHGGINVAPVWAGSAVYYAASKGGAFEIWARDSSATSSAVQVLSSADRHRHLFPSSVSRDSRMLAYTETGGPARGDVSVVSLPSKSVVAAVQTPFDETSGMLSPDGRLLAYQSDESGRWEISLLRIADNRRVAISGSGGTAPVWSGDGRTLFYRSGDALVSVVVDAAGGATATAVPVMTLHDDAVAGITPDGRILLSHNVDPAPRGGVLTLEWARELRKILGPPAATLPR